MMFDKLKQIKNQYEERLRRLEEPETYSDPVLYAKIDREARELAPLVEAYRAYESACTDIAAAQELMDDPELLRNMREQAIDTDPDRRPAR